MTKKINSTLVVFIVTILLLSIPFIAMQISGEVDWSPLDFTIMGTLIFSVGLFIDFVRRKVDGNPRKVILIALGILTFLLIWAELAVGIFGSPFAGS